MFRIIWLLAALGVALIFGLILTQLMPEILTLILPARAQNVVDLLAQATTLSLGTYAATTIFTFTLIGLAGLAIWDMYATRRIRTQLDPLRQERAAGKAVTVRDLMLIGEENGDLGLLVGAYGQSLKPAAEGGSALATTSAADFIGPQIVVEQRLSAWLFRGLAALLLGLGFLLLITSLAVGVDHVMFEGGISAGAVSGGFLLSLEIGLLTLLVTASGALVTAAIVRAVTELRAGQATMLVRDLDGLFFAAGSGSTNAAELREALGHVEDGLSATVARMTELERALAQNLEASASLLGEKLEQALNEPLATLQTGSEALAADQREKFAGMVEAALNAFTAHLSERYGDHMKDMGATLEAAATAAKNLEKAVGSTQSNALKALADQSRTLGKSLDGTQKSLKDLQPLLKKSVEQQGEIRKQLDGANAPTRVLQKASKDMAAAAQASRDTVERFIALAERLREASRAITTTPQTARQAADVSAVADAQGDEKNTEAARRLSQAIRELRRIASAEASGL